MFGTRGLKWAPLLSESDAFELFNIKQLISFWVSFVSINIKIIKPSMWGDVQISVWMPFIQKETQN